MYLHSPSYVLFLYLASNQPPDFVSIFNMYKEGWLLLRSSGKYHISSNMEELRHIFVHGASNLSIQLTSGFVGRKQTFERVYGIFHVASTNLLAQRISVI